MKTELLCETHSPLTLPALRKQAEYSLSHFFYFAQSANLLLFN